MNKIHNPDTIAPPLGAYSHAIEVPPNARWLYVSGQVGIRPDGAVAEGIEAQTEQAWRNVIAVLAAADMGIADLVRVNTYVTQPEYVAAARNVRVQMLGDIKPASTLVVAALVSADLLVEVEAIAAKA